MKDFRDYLQAKNLTKSTQDYYLLYVERFEKWYGKDIINCEKKDILKYLAYLKNSRNQQNITRRNSLIALNHYFTFLLQNKITTTNPTALIKIRGTQKKLLYNIYTLEELEQLHDTFYHTFIRNFDDTHIPKNQQKQSFLNRQRNYVILGLLCYQGLATNEVQNITLDDLDLIKATIKVQRKGIKRTLSLHASQMGALMHYTQNIRPQFLEYRTDDPKQLFLPLPESGRTQTKSNHLMSIFGSLSANVKNLVPDFVNFKQVRASVITQWIKTHGLRKAQYLAGHKNINSTEYYLPNDLESLTDDITKYNPF